MLRHSQRHHRARSFAVVFFGRRVLLRCAVLVPSVFFGSRRVIRQPLRAGRAEERSYRQRVRRALARGDDPPRYRHDWAN